MKTITTSQLIEKLNERIEYSTAELTALKAVKINTSHKALNNKSVENARIGDYLGIDKALYISFIVEHRYYTLDVIAYTYNGLDGKELGAVAGLRTSRTLTPAEMRESLDDLIEGREKGLETIKSELTNADKIVKRYNKIAADYNEFDKNITWVTRSLIN